MSEFSANEMKILNLPTFLLMLSAFSCGNSPPKIVDNKEVCAQPAETLITIQGYLSLPEMLEVTKYMRDGQSIRINHKLFLMTEPEVSGEAVAVMVSGTNASEPNKIRSLPTNYRSDDLIAYSDGGETKTVRDLVKLTGIVEPNDKNGCQVSVTKIEDP